MKSIVIDCVTVAVECDRVILSAPAGHSVSVSRAGLFRALAELDGRPETPPAPPEPGGGWDAADWVALTVPAIENGRPCRYRVGVARGGPPGWESWQIGHLAVETRDYDVPRPHRDQTRFWRKGEPASVTVMGFPQLPEYAPDELGEDGVFAADAGDRTILLQIEVPA